MTAPRRRRLILGVAVLALAGAAASVIVADARHPAPTLDGLDPLIASRRFDEAGRRIRDYLHAYPRSAQANLLMAQVCLGRDDPKPREALAYLDRVEAVAPRVRAMVLLSRGKAESALGRNDRAEDAWKEALRLDPAAAEVGWDLLGLYYIQGRREDAHRLAMELHAVEPDPRDRALLLLEVIRQDAQPIGADSLIKTLGPIAEARPEDRYTSIALGQALVRASRADEGLAILRDLSERFPGDADARRALLLGLDEARRLPELAASLANLPDAMSDDPRFARFRATMAQERREWAMAADEYLRARQSDPSDIQVLYRLSRALRTAGRSAEAEHFDRAFKAAQETREGLLKLYEEADAVKDLGVAPHPDLCRRLADARERMGRPDEALEWHRLVLRDRPDDPISRAASERLEEPGLPGDRSDREGRTARAASSPRAR